MHATTISPERVGHLEDGRPAAESGATSWLASSHLLELAGIHRLRAAVVCRGIAQAAAKLRHTVAIAWQRLEEAHCRQGGQSKTRSESSDNLN